MNTKTINQVLLEKNNAIRNELHQNFYIAITSINQDFPGTSPRDQNTFNLLPTGFASNYAPEYPNLEKKCLDQTTSSVYRLSISHRTPNMKQHNRSST